MSALGRKLGATLGDGDKKARRPTVSSIQRLYSGYKRRREATLSGRKGALNLNRYQGSRRDKLANL